MNIIDPRSILHHRLIEIFSRRYTRQTSIRLAFLVLFPSLILFAELINGYMIYRQAHDGIHHLETLRTLFHDSIHQPAILFTPTKLAQADQEMTAAHDDFQQLSTHLQFDPTISMLGILLPSQITSLRSLSQIAVDATAIGQQTIHAAIQISPQEHSALLPASKQPLITPAVMRKLDTVINAALPHLRNIAVQSSAINLSSLPLSTQQSQQLQAIFQVLPALNTILSSNPHGMENALAWLLGVNAPHTILIQTMDRSELRPTGGFTGQFGELSINQGRIAPFTLHDIGPIEEQNPTSRANGRPAPAPYTWWPVPNWGLRDSNISADFPTSAHLAILAYHDEFDRAIDGDVVFSPFLISRILQVIGPIYIPEYHETITPQNLEARLHYYQLDNRGILKEIIVEKIPQTPANPQVASSQARKLFTRRLANDLIARLKSSTLPTQLALAQEMLYSLKTKDLEIYINNPTLENLIAKYGSTGSIDRSNAHDGLYVVQANLSTSKASQYVHTTIQDNVTLNNKGGATHVMRLKLIYRQAGPVYGFDTYRDYLRIYVPPNSKLLSGDGFDQGYDKPLCGGPYKACPGENIYGNGALLCPPNQSLSGYSTWLLNDPYYGLPHPMDQIGPPTNTTSDEPGRAMYGGWVIVPKNCTMTVTLSWYVPPLSQHYSLLVQRQSSTFPLLDLTILPTTSDCHQLQTARLHYNGVLGGEDRLFTPPSLPQSTTCYPPPPI